MHTIAFLIDGSYLDHVLMSISEGKRIDYQALIRAIVDKAGGDRSIIRVYYYHCLPYQEHPPTQEQSERFGKMQRFFRAVQRMPRFEVKQ